MSEYESKPKRWGCFHYVIVALICFTLLLIPAWFCLFRSIPLRISPETTYITEPLDATGKWVDYFRAMELKLYPPEMATDDNGVRIIVRALGIGEEVEPDFKKIYYGKLSLDPNVPPTHLYRCLDGYLHWAKTNHTEAYEVQKKKMYERYVKETLDKFRAGPGYSGEEKEQMIQEWEARPQSYLSEEIPTLTADGGETFNWEENTNWPLPQDYATWKPYFFMSLSWAPWTIEEKPIMEYWLRDCSPALDLIAEAVQKPAFAIPSVRLHDDDPYAMLTMLLPEVQTARNYARGFHARANYRIGQGDFDGAFDDMIACFRLGRHIGHQGFLISNLVGIAIEGIAAGIDFNFPGENQPTAEQLRRLLHEIDNLPPRSKIETVFETERFFGLDSLQSTMRNVMTGKGSGMDGWFGDAFTLNVLDRTLSFVGIDWNVVFMRLNKAYDGLLAGTLDESVWHFDNNIFSLPYRMLTLKSRSELVANFFVSLFLPAFNAAKEAMWRTECADHLKRLVLAMLIYEREHGTLSPAFTVDADGKPLHSWRVLLLPYLGEEAKDMYENIRLDEPWDNEHNRQFHEKVLDVFQCPSANNRKKVDGGTHYSVIVGDETAFGDDGKGRSSNDFKKNMLLFTERRTPICWMKPDDEISQADAGLDLRQSPTVIGGRHPNGVYLAAMKGGSVRQFSEPSATDKLREIIIGTDSEVD